MDLEQAILEKDVYSIIIEEKFRLLGETINYFPDRAEEYAKLANLSNLYKEKDKPRDLLLRATDNFLGYGYHKDTYLFDVLEAIEFCTKTTIGSQRINNWTERIMPLIMNAGNYTDGDETNHLPSYLADFLSTNNKLLLFKFYFFQANKEELFPAQETFQYIIRALSLTQDIEQALAATAIDSDSFKELKEKATTSKEAQNAVSFIQDYFGEIYYKDRDYSSSSDYKEQIINYAEVKPRKLKKYLSQIKTKWDFEKYICGWAKYWLDHYKKKKLYTLIKSIAFKDEDIHSVSGEILDILYPLAYEFENRKTFAFLCSAQENDRGWARHWTDKRKAEKRWDFVRQKYPTRYLEFFKVSANYSVPLSRGVEFFCRFNDLEKAEMITEASVDFAEELMADLILEIPAWSTNTFQKVDELDLLFQRLIWPSPLARERAATEIAKLLVYSPEKKEIYRRLLEWIKSWRIESIIAIGLLPLLKAFQVCEHESDLSFIKISDIKESIQASSIVIEELLKELALRTKESIGDLPTYLDTENLPTSYNINKFFDKYIKTILAPIYFIRAEEIEEKTVSSFIDVWAYNAEVIAKEYNIELESNHYFYGRHENEKFLIGFSTKVSEVYRSAFLRVLHDFYVKGLLPGDFYLEYSFSTLPIDLSFWSFLPNRSPDWWPKLLNAKNNGAEKKISTIQFKEPIENIIRYQKDSKIILAAEGAIEPEGGWSEDPMHSFSLIGFGYNVLGANLPDAEEIGRKTLFAPQTVIIPTKADHLAYFFHNSFYFDIHSKPDQIKNLLVHPLITRNSDLTINLWQYFRDKNPSFNVNEALRSDLRIVLKNNKWILEDKNNKEFVIFEDWLEGLQERYEFEIPTPYGHYVLIDNQYLKSFLEKNNLRLGYLLQTIYRGRKYSYDKIQEMKESKLINISNLIIPV